MALAVPTFDTLVDGNAPKPYPTKSIDVFISGRITELLEKWYPLPGEPGNSLHARTKVPADKKPLYMFPKLDEMNLELFFHRRMFCQISSWSFAMYWANALQATSGSIVAGARSSYGDHIARARSTRKRRDIL